MFIKTGKGKEGCYKIPEYQRCEVFIRTNQYEDMQRTS